MKLNSPRLCVLFTNHNDYYGLLQSAHDTIRTVKAPKTDYQKQTEQVIKEIQGKYKPTLLLHACCGPCSSYVIEFLSEYFNITIYYYNPNIYPEQEYNRRLKELEDFLPRFPPASENKVKLIKADYIPEEFYEATNTPNEKELQTEAERGERCRRCYLLRLKHSYEYACQNGFDYFTTTLSISPYKDAEKINIIGNDLEKTGTTKFLPSDFKKKNGFLRSLQISSEYGLYRQDYCGCVYSKQNTEKQRNEKNGSNSNS